MSLFTCFFFKFVLGFYFTNQKVKFVSQGNSKISKALFSRRIPIKASGFGAYRVVQIKLLLLFCEKGKGNEYRIVLGWRMKTVVGQTERECSYGLNNMSFNAWF